MEEVFPVEDFLVSWAMHMLIAIKTHDTKSQVFIISFSN